MAVQVEKIDNLRRKITIQIDSATINQQYQNKLREYAKKTVIKGFRPGQISPQILAQRFGQGIRRELAAELADNYFRQAIADEGLEIASVLPNEKPLEIKENQPLEFSVECEVVPSVSFSTLSDIKATRYVCQVDEKDIDALVEQVKQNDATWLNTDRPAQNGDRLIIDFVGRLDDEPFEGGQAESFTLTLGSGTLVPGFEEGLVGTQAEETREITVTIPKDYHHPPIAGREVVFAVKVHQVMAAQLPDIDEAWAQQKGYSNLTAFLESQKTALQRKAELAAFDHFKQNVLKAWAQHNPIDIPQALIDEEIQRIKARIHQRMARNLQQDIGHFNLPGQLYQDQARQSVHVGILLRELIKQQQLNVNDDEVWQMIDQMAQQDERYGQLRLACQQDDELFSTMKSRCLENKIVAWLSEQMTIEEKTVSLNALQTLLREAHEGENTP